MDGLASGVSIAFDISIVMTRFSINEQISGWFGRRLGAIAWWAGVRFEDFFGPTHLRRRLSGCGSSRRPMSINYNRLPVSAAYNIDTPGKQPREPDVNFVGLARSITAGVPRSRSGAAHYRRAAPDQLKPVGETISETDSNPRDHMKLTLGPVLQSFGKPQQAA